VTMGEMIKGILKEDSELKKLLSVYHSEPAVFEDTAFLDEAGYEQNNKYPYIIVTVSESENPKRQDQGSLTIRIFDKAGEGCTDEIEKAVKRCLHYLFIKPYYVPVTFRWYRTKEVIPYPCNATPDENVKRVDLHFDRFIFPNQETADPDPVIALQRHLKEFFPEAVFLGTDDFGEMKYGDSQNSLIYCTLKRTRRGEETHAVTWLDSDVTIQVMNASFEYRQKVLTAILHVLSAGDEVNTLNGIPMFVKTLEVDYKADIFTQGQLQITFHYGLSRYTAKPHILSGVQVTYTL